MCQFFFSFCFLCFCKRKTKGIKQTENKNEREEGYRFMNRRFDPFKDFVCFSLAVNDPLFLA